MNNSASAPKIYTASTPIEVAEIQSMRYQVYVEEMELNPAGTDHIHKVLADTLDSLGTHLYMREGTQVDGAVRLNLNTVPSGLEECLQVSSLPRPFVYCSRLYVRKALRGRGGMGELAKACFDFFPRNGAAAAICHCYPHLLKLYARLGFEKYGVPFLAAGLEYLGPQYPLRCLLDQGELALAA